MLTVALLVGVAVVVGILLWAWSSQAISGELMAIVFAIALVLAIASGGVAGMLWRLVNVSE